jgi:hypothetical protein
MRLSLGTNDHGIVDIADRDIANQYGYIVTMRGHDDLGIIPPGHNLSVASPISRCSDYAMIRTINTSHIACFYRKHTGQQGLWTKSANTI